MKKSERFRFGAAMAMAVALIFYAGSRRVGQLDTDVPLGHLKVQTALETDWGVSTAGKPNRNNDNNHIPGSGQGLSTDGDDLQSANGRVEPLITLRISDDAAQSMWLDDADAYVHLRYWADVAQLINGPRVNTVGQGDMRRQAFRAIPATHGRRASASTSTKPMLLRRTSIFARGRSRCVWANSR